MNNRQLSESSSQIDAVDGLRGFAALVVFISHASQVGLHLIPGISLFGIGKYGVFLFFLLSAFLLTQPFVRTGKAGFGRDILINYGLRRFFRIYPLYLGYILCGLGSTVVLSRLTSSGARMGIPFALDFREFVDHLLLQRGYSVTWSILVEFRYYFLLPVVAAVLGVLLGGRLIPCVVAGVAAIGLTSWWFPPVDKAEYGYSLPEYLPLFLAGSTLAVVHRAWSDGNWSRHAWLRWCMDFGAIACGLFILARTPTFWGWITGKAMQHDAFHNQYALWALLWAVVLLSVLHGQGMVRKFFEGRFLRYLGTISFSVYLIHIVVLTWADKKAGTVPGIGWISLLVTLGISHLTWKWIEVPSSRIRWSARRGDAARDNGKVA